eukprot:gene20321-22320_t
MSRCFGCAAKFGIFKREHGCKNCGKSFCSGCLSFQAIIPPSIVVQQVCKNCFKKLAETPDSKTTQSNAPPSYYEALQPPPSQSAPSKHQMQPDPDAEIRARLAKLKDKDNIDKKEKHSDESIADRFQNLTGRPATSTQKKQILKPQPKLSEQEQINRLMEQAMAEANLSKESSDDDDSVKRNSNKDIENQLLLLKGVDPEKVKEKDEDVESSEDENEAAAKILKMALAESKLDDKVKGDGYGDLIDEQNEEDNSRTECGVKLPSVPQTAIGGTNIPTKRIINDDDDDDELPWCCICNANATLRCHGCDDDIYCKRCYREGHAEFHMDLEEHRTSVFKPKRKK